MSDKELYKELVEWFKKYEDSPDKWNKTYCGELIKRKLTQWGNFKNARRGNRRHLQSGRQSAAPLGP